MSTLELKRKRARRPPRHKERLAAAEMISGLKKGKALAEKMAQTSADFSKRDISMSGPNSSKNDILKCRVCTEIASDQKELRRCLTTVRGLGDYVAAVQ